jgi:hypothetical protein
MNPLKRSKISEQTANQLGLPVDLVDDVASFYYKYIQKKLTNLDYININVPNLGIFCLKKNSVSRKLTKYELAIEKMELEICNDKKMSMKRYESIVDMKKHVANYSGALDLLQEEEERKKVKLKERKKYESESNKNLES